MFSAFITFSQQKNGKTFTSPAATVGFNNEYDKRMEKHPTNRN